MVFAAFVLTVMQAAAPAQSFEPATIRNFVRVTTEFCTGGQPEVEHFARLRADGVRAVVNLRTPGEHRADEERQAVEAAGLRYFNIPVIYKEPRAEQADEFLRITDDPANRPVFIHCTAAIRVGAFWLIRRVARDGWTWDAALAEARKVGLVNAPHLEEFAKVYLASRPAGRQP
jgi:uncharacterized protein (TIGR01244 family)